MSNGLAGRLTSVGSIEEMEVSDSDNFIPCKDLIKYNIPDDVPWRSRQTQPKMPIFQEMIGDIIRFRRLWKSGRRRLDPRVRIVAEFEMKSHFINHINIEEDIGTQELSATKKIMNDMDTDKENAYPHPGKSGHLDRSKKNRETKNLYLAWQEVVRMAEEERKLDPTNSGLLEMKQCVNHLHKILMTGVITEAGQTAPGVFSTNVRWSSYNEKVHKYPQKDTQEEWETEISTLIDRYNALIEFAKKDLVQKIDKADGTFCIFKCAAWFLFNLVSLHPFSDGNGRLCRLLASYTLLLITPFPSPIYNIFSETKKDDYVEAIIRARTSPDKHPDHLAALMIECNWAAWKKFLEEVGIKY